MPDKVSQTAQASKREATKPRRAKRGITRLLAKLDGAFPALCEGVIRVAVPEDVRRSWAILDDETGAEAERHLVTFNPEYVRRARALALGENGSWHDWGARALAALFVFLGYEAQPTTLHGQRVWVVRGYTMGFYRMMMRRRVHTSDGVVWRVPSVGTVGHLSRKKTETGLHAPSRGWMGRLRDSQLVSGFQFEACKVPASMRSKPRVLPNGEVQQWAFGQIFLHVCPWRDGEVGPVACKARERQVAHRVNVGRSREQYRALAKAKKAQRKAEAERLAADVDALPWETPLEPRNDSEAAQAVQEALTECAKQDTPGGAFARQRLGMCQPRAPG